MEAFGRIPHGFHQSATRIRLPRMIVSLFLVLSQHTDRTGAHQYNNGDK
jgi:hypothetical protein